jgi:hypothetical protein
VGLRLQKASAERWDKDILFRCDVTLDNETGKDLTVKSNFNSVFDGLQIVVTAPDGKVLAQQGYIFHQSPSTVEPRKFTLNKGNTTDTIVFPISTLPGDAKSFKVRLVGTLPGSGYDRELSSKTLTIEVRDRPRE